MNIRRGISLTALAGALALAPQAAAQTVVDPKLEVGTIATGLSQPVQLEFIGEDDFFVLEKATGKVKRIKGGATTEVLDLPVNSNSERGLLGIALDKYFRHNGAVYLYWSENTLTTGADSPAAAEVPLMGNRLDRFRWDGSKLTYDKTLHRSRAFQADANQPIRGNHNGGVLRTGPDGKLYLQVGDTGRRGQTQTCSTARSAKGSRTTSSAVPTSSTTISRA